MKTTFVIGLLALSTFLGYSLGGSTSEGGNHADQVSSERDVVPIARVFEILEAENDVVRELWSKEIVGTGKTIGLSFREDWRDREVEAGPLPALFLRMTADVLARRRTGLGLFLGSSHPINDANAFRGKQAATFERIRQEGAPHFFLTSDTQLHTAMFADFAVADSCVTCHNNHAQSPKTDWKLGDLMGATTWSYGKAEVTTDELLSLVAALRSAIGETYGRYIDKTKTFDIAPQIGSQWPRDGYFLPSKDAFMAEFQRRSSHASMTSILQQITNNGSNP